MSGHKNGASNADKDKVYNIRPLRESPILFVDSSEESKKVETLLKTAGLDVITMDGQVEPWERKPLLLFNGGYYEGLDSIRELLELLEFWSSQEPLIQRTLFASV